MQPIVLRPVAPPVEYGITKRLARAGNAAIALLRSLGTSAHVWLPGANGTTVASLPSNNYLLSDGSTGYSTVDGVVGLTLDGMGALGSELVTNGSFATNDFTGWSVVAGTWSAATGAAVCTAGTNSTIYQAILTIGTFYKITVDVVSLTGSITLYAGASTSVSITSTGSKTYYLTCFGDTNLYVQFATTSTGSVDNISVKEYTGTHLSQPTTANKPLVRRGAYNLLTYSEQFNLSWTASNMTVAASDSLIPTAANASHAVVGTSIAKTAAALKYVVSGRCKANGYSFLLLRIDAGAGDGVYVGFNVSTGAVSTAAATSGAGWVAGTAVIATPSSDGYCNFSIPFTTGTETIIRVIPYVSNATGAAFSPSSFAGDTTSGINLKIQLEQGVTTAGDYTPTTATAASNPSAGKYWWSFDGSNDSLLSGNLGITNACTIVIAGRVNSLAGAFFLFSETASGVSLVVNTNGSTEFYKTGSTALVSSAAGVVVAGVPFVLTFRLSGGTAVIRKNGAQVATAASALTFAATGGARLGVYFDGVSNPMPGALGWVVPLPAALSDADCLTVERLVGSQFPGMAAF